MVEPAMEKPAEKAIASGKDAHVTNDTNDDDTGDARTEEIKDKEKTTAGNAPGGHRDEGDSPEREEVTKSGKSAAGTDSAEILGDNVMQPKKKRKNRLDWQQRLFQDSITVFIPLNVTADLRTAIQRTRTKRIQSIFKCFPSLKKEVQKRQEEENEDPMVDEDEDESKKKSKEKAKDGGAKSVQEKKQKPSAHVPQPHQYSSVLDYLEAKYVKGVMVGDEDEDGASLDDKSEGQGSVYSGGSFLDDADLQRDVAEQVMASTTMTKLELEEDDADFFVNVGNLEVEDNEYGDHYDPLQDKETQPTKTKKRKKSQASAPGSASKKSKTSETKGKAKLATSSTSVKSAKSAGSSKASPSKSVNTEEKKRKQKLAKQAKAASEKLFRKVVAMIKAMTEEELPRRRTKLKVALTCPSNKKAGDDITFTNPHNPGQRLRVKVPKDCFPGGSFKVSVPVKPPNKSDKDGEDQNKFPRSFQDLLDDYARAYDDWCQAQADADKNFAPFKEKQQKFDRFVKEFPSNLVTPVDANYLKKIVRRARQNKHKRSKTAATKVGKGSQESKTKDEPVSDQEDEEEAPAAPKGRQIHIPTKGIDYPTSAWNDADFALEGWPLSSSLSSLKPSSKGRTISMPAEGTIFRKIVWQGDDFA